MIQKMARGVEEGRRGKRTCVGDVGKVLGMGTCHVN